MKVLWFAVTPSKYDKNNTSHNGGGWIESLETIVHNIPNVYLGIAFEHSDKSFKVERNSTIYYPISISSSKKYKIQKKLFNNTEEELLIPQCLKIIDDFRPDIIQIFGSEWSYGLIAKYTTIPIVIHMQGCMPPYINATYPPGYNKYDIVKFAKWNLKIYIKYLFLEKNKNREQIVREENILKINKYYMGRTDWDHSLIKLYSLDSKYFYCSEALRQPFMDKAGQWEVKNRQKIIFATIGGGNMLKGIDTVLKTAKLLKENTNLDFEWRLYGPSTMISFFEWKEKIKIDDVNIKLMGVLIEDDLCEALLDTDIYIHPSYMDNSPNALCEAQLLGVPIIATYVGGIPSLISDMQTGILVPSNEPHILAYKVKCLSMDKLLQQSISQSGKIVAIERHSPKNIEAQLMNIYTEILSFCKDKN